LLYAYESVLLHKLTYEHRCKDSPTTLQRKVVSMSHRDDI